MSDFIDISGLDKAEVLAALYNASRPFGMGHLHYVPGDMTREEAQGIIDERGDDLKAMFGVGNRPAPFLDFDYLRGRLIKCNLSEDVLDVWRYDHDLGTGAAARALAPLLEKKEQHASS